METFQITHEISGGDYAEAILRRRQQDTPSGWARWALPLVGLVVVLLPFISREPDGSFNLVLVALAGLGAYLLFCGVLQILARRNKEGLNKPLRPLGGQCTATFADDSLLIEDKSQLLKIKWAALGLREESERLFMFSSGLVLYVVAKSNFSEQQLAALRAFLAGLPQD